MVNECKCLPHLNTSFCFLLTCLVSMFLLINFYSRAFFFFLHHCFFVLCCLYILHLRFAVLYIPVFSLSSSCSFKSSTNSCFFRFFLFHFLFFLCSCSLKFLLILDFSSPFPIFFFILPSSYNSPLFLPFTAFSLNFLLYFLSPSRFIIFLSFPPPLFPPCFLPLSSYPFHFRQ